jgi:hypothetical protein
MIAIKLKFLATNNSYDLSLPSDLSIESLFDLLPDFTDAPVEDLRLIYGGRALQPQDTLASIGIRDGQVISVSAKPRPRADPPPLPAPNLTLLGLRQRLAAVQQRLADVSRAAAAAQEALFEPQPDDQVDQLLREIDRLGAELTAFSESPYATVALDGGALLAPDDGPALTDELREELGRVAATLGIYAQENRLADPYVASDLYRALVKRKILG